MNSSSLGLAASGDKMEDRNSEVVADMDLAGKAEHGSLVPVSVIMEYPLRLDSEKKRCENGASNLGSSH